jgi:hypothetical protein
MYLKQVLTFLVILAVELVRNEYKTIIKVASVASAIIFPIIIISNLLLIPG